MAQKPLKPKFIDIYEQFFSGEDPVHDNGHFWQDLFLLKVNVPFLKTCFGNLSDDSLRLLSYQMNLIFMKASATLKNEHPVRVSNALLTLSIFLKCIFERKYHNFGYDSIHLICGLDRRETFFKDLLTSLSNILLTAESDEMRILALNVLINIVTATDNINQNTLLEYFLINDMYDTIIQTFVTSTCEKLRSGALFILMILVNYQKFESVNSYLSRLRSNPADKIQIFLVNALTRSLTTINENYHQGIHTVVQQPSFMQKIVGMFSFYSTPPPPAPAPTEEGPLLLSSAQASPLSLVSAPAVGIILLAIYELVLGNKNFSLVLLGWKEGSDEKKRQVPPILIQLFTFCANLFSEIESNVTIAYSKLSLMILTIIAENLQLNKLMHDNDMSIPPIDVYRDITTKHSIPAPLFKPRPLGCYFIDLAIHFIKMNTRRDTFHPQLHILAMDFIHRIICYEIKSAEDPEIMRIDYKWKELWSQLVILFKFLSHNKRLQEEENLILASKVVHIVNMFITFGDKFLPVQSDYDDLYYELLRSRDILNAFILELDKSEKNNSRLGDYYNMKTILVHFNEKIESWLRSKPGHSLTTEAVFEIIKSNYDTLKLKLQQNLDKYDPFVENPQVGTFFQQLLRMLVTTAKNKENL
uniref:Armadillo-like helical domain-containing protein n=1 Tax=Arcella intermedia TaxID=1963864 RepID=A0A6B2KZK1_9EUKA